MAAEDPVLFEISPDGVAWITLNRPSDANARNQAMRARLLDSYATVAADTSVKVAVLTGSGTRFFCAGMDLKEAAAPETMRERRDRLRRSRDIDLLAKLPVPTIAAVNGYALGGGCEMALACDMRIVATDAKIGLPEVTHGLMPGGGGTQRLARLVGPGTAAELIYTGRLLTGAEATAIGLANRHVAAEDLHQEALELATSIAAHPGPALRSIKEVTAAGTDLTMSAAIDRELEGLLLLLAERDRPTPEAQEAPDA